MYEKNPVIATCDNLEIVIANCSTPESEQTIRDFLNDYFSRFYIPQYGICFKCGRYLGQSLFTAAGPIGLCLCRQAYQISHTFQFAKHNVNHLDFILGFIDQSNLLISQSDAVEIVDMMREFHEHNIRRSRTLHNRLISNLYQWSYK
jgi:hypothetical protein